MNKTPLASTQASDQTQNALSHCPFCGSNEIVTAQLPAHTCYECMDCHAEALLPSTSALNADQHWNKRVPAAGLPTGVAQQDLEAHWIRLAQVTALGIRRELAKGGEPRFSQSELTDIILDAIKVSHASSSAPAAPPVIEEQENRDTVNLFIGIDALSTAPVSRKQKRTRTRRIFAKLHRLIH